MANRTVRGRPGKTIDFKQWVAILALRLDTSSAATFSGASIAFAIPGTILRARGQIMAVLDTATDGDDLRIGFGLALLSTDAFALGATALPDPLGEPEYPWLWWYETQLSSTLMVAGQVSELAATERIMVDTKAMRKFKPGQSLGLVIQTDAVTPADILIGQLRVLIGT